MVLFNPLHAPHPVYHEGGTFAARTTTEDGWWRHESRTRCGLLQHAVEWQDRPGQPSATRGRVERGTWLRADQAALFGRYCGRCQAR